MFKYRTLLALFTAISCSTPARITSEDFYLHQDPPNGVRISDNFFCDATEVSNSDWRFFMYWTRTIFGSDSEEYLATLPDTLAWLDEANCLAHYSVNYLRHSLYDDHPVVGVSQKQAEAYSRWRSDRVLEMFLIRDELITYDTAQTESSYFTIEKYFKGEIPTINKEKKAKYYPVYRLPDIKEWNIIVNYADSVNTDYFEKCKSTSCRECKESYIKIQSDITPCGDNRVQTEPLIKPKRGCSLRERPVYNLRGNVSEWVSEKNKTAGGGWKDTRARTLFNDPYNTHKPNAMTGFRNVCEWKRWEE